MGFSNGRSSAFDGDGVGPPFCPATAAQRARELLSGHPHFCGRADGFKFEWADGVLVVKGTVPTYYLKQLLQNALKKLDDLRTDVRVDVVRSEIDRNLYQY